MSIAGAQFDLYFNSDLVEVNNIAEGNLFNQDGADTYFSQGQIDNINGVVKNVVCVIISPTQEVSGIGTMAIISMTAKTEGINSMELAHIVVGNKLGEAVLVGTLGWDIIINNPPPLSKGFPILPTTTKALDTQAPPAIPSSLSSIINWIPLLFISSALVLLITLGMNSDEGMLPTIIFMVIFIIIMLIFLAQFNTVINLGV